MIQKEGLKSLWKGFGPVALLTAPAHGVYFGPTPPLLTNTSFSAYETCAI
jgi:hypothetical protein